MEKAYILLSCEIGTENEIVSEIKKINEISSVIITYGDYDIVVEAQTNTPKEMDQLITTTLRVTD
jgi:DNA-binding Lrp family transcriptional regulator